LTAGKIWKTISVPEYTTVSNSTINVNLWFCGNSPNRRKRQKLVTRRNSDENALKSRRGFSRPNTRHRLWLFTKYGSAETSRWFDADYENLTQTLRKCPSEITDTLTVRSTYVHFVRFEMHQNLLSSLNNIFSSANTNHKGSSVRPACGDR